MLSQPESQITPCIRAELHGGSLAGQGPSEGTWGHLMTQCVPPPWVPQNGLCHYNQSEMLAKITGYVNVTSGNITAVKAAIYKHGPVAVSIDASHKTFSFYSNGIYYEPKCGELGGMGGPGCPREMPGHLGSSPCC